jgi:hypothetical protein
VQSGAINLWGIQLEIGSAATPLEKLDPADDLRKCQRFYQIGNVVSRGYAIVRGYILAQYTFPSRMRTVPTVTLAAQSASAGTGASSVGNTFADAFTALTVITAAGDTWAYNTFTASADL